MTQKIYGFYQPLAAWSQVTRCSCCYLTSEDVWLTLMIFIVLFKNVSMPCKPSKLKTFLKFYYGNPTNFYCKFTKRCDFSKKIWQIIVTITTLVSQILDIMCSHYNPNCTKIFCKNFIQNFKCLSKNWRFERNSFFILHCN